MDLELSDEQAALADSVRSVLERRWPTTALRTLVETGSGADRLWTTQVGLDWPALCIDKAVGGMGYGPVEAMLVHEECGRAGAGGPLFPTSALFAPMIGVLGSAAQQQRWLPGVANGTCTGTASLIDLLRDDSQPTVQATQAGDDWTLRGTVHSVIEAGAVEQVIVVARSDGGPVVAVVPRGAASAVPVRSVDASRGLWTLTFDDILVPAEDVLGATGDPIPVSAIEHVVDYAVTALAAEQVGTCGAILDMTIRHVKEREQFGVKIGSFQALKHRLADCFLDLEAARASVRVASVALAEDDRRRTVAASSAMALACDTGRRITTDGIQLLGGIGFTWEHDVHLFVKRVLGSSVLLGNAELHRQRVARHIGLVPA